MSIVRCDDGRFEMAFLDERRPEPGAPLKPLALQRVRDFRKATGGQVPLIGVGGIATLYPLISQMAPSASSSTASKRTGGRRRQRIR